MQAVAAQSTALYTDYPEAIGGLIVLLALATAVLVLWQMLNAVERRNEHTYYDNRDW